VNFELTHYRIAGRFQPAAQCCYPPLVARKRAGTKPSISIVGPGNLGSALVIDLARLGYPIRHIVSRGANNLSRAKALARKVRSEVVKPGEALIESDIVWITVPDDAIVEVAAQLAQSHPAKHWRGRVVLHASGARTSDELAALRKKGASVASAHPTMTFVHGKKAVWRGVAFDIEGDDEAANAAFAIATALGSKPFHLEKRNKTLYHTFGSFASPLVIALMSAMEQVAEAAGVPSEKAKEMVWPLLSQTLTNYRKHGAARAFSGPFIRGDVQTVRRHLAALKRTPEAREVYVALVRAAVKRLPVKNREALEKELKSYA
jgi:predicted short-subunit dehydrogenase-like oxidoreductase (DUF2520 family)